MKFVQKVRFKNGTVTFDRDQEEIVVRSKVFDKLLIKNEVFIPFREKLAKIKREF